MTEEQKRELDAQVEAAFRMGNQPPKYGEKPPSDAELSALNSEGARQVYALTRALGLERQLMANAAPWKPKATWYPLNAAGKLAFERIAQARMETAPITRAPRKRRATFTTPLTHCPHCGSSLMEDAA